MIVVVLIIAAAALVWGVIFARRLPLLPACGIMAALGYVLGPPLWTLHAGPVSLTCDRLLIAGLAALCVWQWRQGELKLRTLTVADWLLLALLAYLTLRTAATPASDGVHSSVGPWWRLIAAFWIPAALYLVARSAVLNQRNWQWFLTVLVVLGAYLSFTAFAEITKQWWAVFPRYISDPTLGEHYGRARGPALMSASLGVNLTYTFWAAWLLWPTAGRFGKALLTVLLGAMVGGVLLTFTRSTWIGLAGGLAIIPLLQTPREWRLPLAAAGGLAAVVGAICMMGAVENLSRKDSDGSAEHSVYQRASFVVVSMRMFRDAPLVGHGFGRFYDKKMPYLADRSQQLELDSLRNLDHHNTLLSILTETGIIGLGLFLCVLIAWLRAGWTLYRSENAPVWVRRHGLFTLGVMIAYLGSAVFHDLTLSPTEHWVLFLACGVASGLLAEGRQTAPSAATANRRPLPGRTAIAT
ncbi:MAG: O-antigen ligase family protein [Planctomycetales bacterium]|nr:O-antigen ligase family protein [Planctomycetales bacterium]